MTKASGGRKKTDAVSEQRTTFWRSQGFSLLLLSRLRAAALRRLDRNSIYGYLVDNKDSWAWHLSLAISTLHTTCVWITKGFEHVCRLPDLKLLSQSPRLGTFCLSALGLEADSTLYVHSSSRKWSCPTLDRRILQNGFPPFGSVVNILLICRWTSRGYGSSSCSYPPSQTTTRALS